MRSAAKTAKLQTPVPAPVNREPAFVTNLIREFSLLIRKNVLWLR